MKATSQKSRLIMAIVAVIGGVLMITLAPVLAQVSLDQVLVELVQVSKDKPQYGSGIALFGLFFPLWRALIFVAGAMLIAIAIELYRGEEWAWAIALLAYAMPAIGGMFMFLPHISWVSGFPIPMIISWIGLAGFWTTILLYKSDRMRKIGTVAAFTFMGMLATHSFTLGIGAQRMLLTRPGQPLFTGVEWSILTITGYVVWIGTLMLIIAIPLLALGKPAGWWLAVIASFAILLIDAPTQIVRMATFDYLYGVLLALGTLFCLLFPAFKQRPSQPPSP